MDVDGWITIGTKMDTTKFDKQYEQLMKKAKDQEIKINIKTTDVENAKLKVKELEKEYDRIASNEDFDRSARFYELQFKGIKNLTDEEMKEWFQLSTNSAVYEEIQNQATSKAVALEMSNSKLEQEQKMLKEEKNKYAEILNEIEKVNQAKEQSVKQQTFNSIQSSINNIGKSIQNVTKKVVRWGLAIFGIRSAYMFIRQAMSTLSQYNEQLATDIQYIRFALASTLQPVIEYILKLVIKLLQYLGYIIQKLFGINIFKNSGVDKFQKAMASSSKSAKEIKNQLAGFDEMNVLQDTSDSGAEAGGGGGAIPPIDLSKLQNQKVPKWLETIVEVGRWILDNWEDVVFTLLLVKLFIDLLTGNWIGVVIDLIGLLIIAFKKIWENIKEIIELIKPYFQKFVDWISKNVVEPVGRFFKNLWNGISDGVKTAVNNIKNFFNSIPSFFSGIVNRIMDFFRNIGATVGNVVGSAFKNVINSVLSVIENILNTPIRAINSLINTINKLPNVNLNKLSTFSLPRLAKGGIVNMPSRGVPIGSAIAGERGAEGVIPLTDTQQMTLLGEAIGKYITVHATIPVYAYNRQIDRQVKIIKAEDDFARNV